MRTDGQTQSRSRSCSMTHARRKSLSLLNSLPTGREPLQVEGKRMERQESTEPGAAPEVPSLPSLQELRKNYPLRKRLLGAGKPKTCKVLLTRLEHVAGPRGKEASTWVEELQPLTPGLPETSIPGKGETGGEQEAGTDNSLPEEPRKRRLASLNAEALNNLLLERDDGAGLAATRRCRGETRRARDKVSGSWASPEKPVPKSFKGRSRTRAGRLKGSSQDILPEEVFEDGSRREGDTAPKRLASLNAAAFLKLSQERELPHRAPRNHTDGDVRPDSIGPKTLRLKWAKANRKNCVKARQEANLAGIEGLPSWQIPPEGTWPPTDSSGSPRLCGKGEPLPYESLSHSYESPGDLYHRLPLLMGGQAAMKPEYGRPGEKSPTPKQDLHQPSFPLPQLPPLPVPGNHSDYGCFYGGPELTTLSGVYLYYGQSGLQCGGYSPCPVFPEGGELSPSAPCDGLLVAPSSLPTGTPFQHPPWCSSRYCCGEGEGVNSYSLCGVLPMSLSRVSSLHATHGSCPYKMPFAAESCRSLDQLDLTIPVAGHPASPAHPLSGCPVPNVPPAAEPVPHLQTPNSEPQTMARACPQSAKPPSGSKSGLRTAPSCLHPSETKAVSSHPKQQRIQRRRATNGWVPVGTACEKAVYVVNEPGPAIRKSYQAVERDGEMIRVRDTVLLKSGPRKKSMPYVAKISALWEDPKTGELMMSLLWYYRPEHTQGGRNPSMHQNEIFASRHQDENSVACIEEKCYVLTFAEYCRFCALAKRRGEGLPGQRAALVPPSVEYSTPPHRTVPEDTDPDLVFLCRHVYDFRHGRILKNPQ
ncbi:bromo adjacent homology domain-containing 1 protein isoform 1-T1 [Sarcophilus harrisii]